MDIEYDRNKSIQNLEKHGINFEQAQALWNDPRLLEIPARTEQEPRSMLIGKIGGRHWSAIVTYRNNTIRIISVRRSRIAEVNLYEG